MVKTKTTARKVKLTKRNSNIRILISLGRTTYSFKIKHPRREFHGDVYSVL